MNVQLEFFEETREEKLHRQMSELRKTAEKSRKSQYAKIAELKKIVFQQKERLDILESAICKEDLFYLKK